MRKILRHEIEGSTLIGTLHVPPEGASARADSQGRRVGLFLANFAQAPRAGVGDLSALIGDAAAAAGVPTFRFDLPGLGDYSGEAPPVGQPLWEFIRDGGHATTASVLIDRLLAEHRLDAFIVGGLCAGAVTAMYTAAQPGVAAAGLILLEPVFHMCDLPLDRDPIPSTATGEGGAAAAPDGPPRSRTPRSRSLREFVSARLPRGRATRVARNLYAHYKRLRDVLLTGSTTPDANRVALRSWRLVTRARTPILMVNGAVDGREAYNRYYLGAGFRKHVTWTVIPDTNHMLAANGGRDVVTSCVASWLSREFGAA